MQYLNGKAFAEMFKNKEANKDKICDGFRLIAEGVIRRGEGYRPIAEGQVKSGGYFVWVNDADRDDAISHAVLTCIQVMGKYDTTRNSSAFSYFTQVATHAVHYHLKRMKRSAMVSLDRRMEDLNREEEYTTIGAHQKGRWQS